ncbi:MAG: helix-hairpin-helix domain-containing protein [Lachnospiraceae bacterium]|nr:helix-hairpin-helix domain-containing protein [Candidatus Equihabitans merdae]
MKNIIKIALYSLSLLMLTCLTGCGSAEDQAIFKTHETELNAQETSSENDGGSVAAYRDGSADGVAENASGSSDDLADDRAGTESGTGDAGTGNAVETGNESSVSRKQIIVDVCGAVAVEGVYSLPEGSRVHEAIEMAGGLTEGADRKRLNEARVLSDGEQIIVYMEGESQVPADSGGPDISSAGSGQAAQALININTADISQLMTLSGIGEAKATAIIKDRDTNGPFQTKEDIMRVSGIGDGMYARIKDDITV